MTQLEFSSTAAADLDEILEYIAKDNPRRGRAFVELLREKCRVCRRGVLLCQPRGWRASRVHQCRIARFGLRLLPSANERRERDDIALADKFVSERIAPRPPF